jgi:hypothetical protein
MPDHSLQIEQGGWADVVLERGVYPWVNIQRSRLESGERVFRLEDCMADACSTLAQVFERGWGLRVDRQRLEEVVSRNSFEKLRRAGVSAARKTSNHITARVFMVTGEIILRRPSRAVSNSYMAICLCSLDTNVG